MFVLFVLYSIISIIIRAVVRVPVASYWYYTVSVVPGWLNAILWLLYLPLVALCVLGIMNAVNGQMKPLPVIGKVFTLLK